MSLGSESLKNLKPEDVRRLEVLSRIGKRINTPERFSEALQAVLDSVVESMEAERGALFLSPSPDKAPTLALFTDQSDEATEEGFRHSTTVVEKVWVEGVPIAEVDTRDNAMLAALSSIRAEGIRSVICVPLVGRVSKLGVLYLDNRISSPFTKGDLEMLDVIADLASTALERARFFEDLQELNNELEARVEQRTAEAVAARQEAERATRAKSLFLAKMSHELRTPLNGILGLTEDLAEREDNPALRLQLEQVVESARSLSTLINAVLDFSKLESEQVQIDRHAFRVEEAVVEALATINYEASKKGLELQVWIDETCPVEVEGDSTRLKQVLINLLGNAVKFTPKGWVRLIVSSNKNDILQFSVADSGVGIPDEKQADIFKPFSQADASTTREFGGTGLGLSICRSLCQLMGGHLTVESTAGEGSRFAFQLPLKFGRLFEAPHYAGLKVNISVSSQPQQMALERAFKGWGCVVCKLEEAELAIADSRSCAPNCPAIILVDPGEIVDPNLVARANRRHILTPVTRSALVRVVEELLNPSQAIETSGSDSLKHEPNPPKGASILVAEDHEINRLVIERMLASWGYSCVFAGTGPEAVEQYLDHRPRLVLMDIEMPGQDGFEAARILRSKALGMGATPIIAVTAHLASDLRERCLASGMDDFITKPIARKDLASRLGRWEAVLRGEVERQQARHGDFSDLGDWDASCRRQIETVLCELSEPSGSPSSRLEERFARLERSLFSAGLLDWGGRCVALPRPLSAEEVGVLIQAFQQEWSALAPTLLPGS
jgi:signal transduction histidine kinase/CheY-like chemotaxis protein